MYSTFSRFGTLRYLLSQHTFLEISITAQLGLRALSLVLIFQRSAYFLSFTNI